MVSVLPDTASWQIRSRAPPGTRKIRKEVLGWSVEYLRRILTENSGRSSACWAGAQAIAGGCDFYREDYAYEIETKYGRSPGEIFSSSFFRNRPKAFYECYREELLKKRGGPDECNYALKRMEDDGMASGNCHQGIF